MKSRILQFVAASAVAIGLLGGSVACGSEDKVNAADDQACVYEQSAEQVAQLRELPQVANVQADAYGTSTVCILKDDGNGGYSQHIYDRDDNFTDYLLYAAMTGRGSSLMGYGVLTGAIDPFDAMILGSLYGVKSRGGLYQPYSYYGADRGWGRQNVVVKNVTVKNVTYGNSTPIPFKDAKKKRPASYQPVKVKKASDKVATVNGTTLTEDKGKSAKKVLKGAKTVAPPVVTLPAVRNVAPAPAVSNPNASVVPSRPAPAPVKPSPSAPNVKPSSPKVAPVKPAPAKPPVKPQAPKGRGR